MVKKALKPWLCSFSDGNFLKDFTNKKPAQKMELRKRRFVNEGEILEYLDALDSDYSEHDDLGGNSGK